jgi:ankyrin repeat protein
LVAAGADVNAKDKEGRTPLSWASDAGIAELLRKALDDVPRQHAPRIPNPLGASLMNPKLAIDERLVEEARRAGQHANGTEAVHRALEEYVARHRRQRIVELFGTVEFDEDYDYKAERRKDSV